MVGCHSIHFSGMLRFCGFFDIMQFSGIVKENMLIILGHLLSLVPSEVQSRELPPLLPLLFEALSSTEDGLV